MKKLFILLFSVAFIAMTILPVKAYSIYMEDKENQHTGANVDKYQPTSGVKITPSGLAQMMENATRNATQNKSQYNNTKQQNTEKPKSNNSYSFF